MRQVGLAVLLLVATRAAADGQERKYAPYAEYAMPRDAEVALARSAAPASISAHATIEVLTPSGFEVAVKGDNGFLCMVMRSWSAAPDPDTHYARLRAPICFDPIAARTVAPAERLKTRLGLAGTPPDEIDREVAVRYGRGQLPRMEGVAFAYMWSANQDTGREAGAWHPHMMIYVPYYENAMLGGNGPGHHAPFVAGSGTPYATAVIAVDDELAVKVREK